jgi:hypothetical protein
LLALHPGLLIVLNSALRLAFVDGHRPNSSITERVATGARTVEGWKKHDFDLSHYSFCTYFWRWNNR